MATWLLLSTIVGIGCTGTVDPADPGGVDESASVDASLAAGRTRTFTGSVASGGVWRKGIKADSAGTLTVTLDWANAAAKLGLALRQQRKDVHAGAAVGPQSLEIVRDVSAGETFTIFVKSLSGSSAFTVTVNLDGAVTPPPPAPACGDASCNGTETCSDCASDCGACPPVATCGDAACNGSETCNTCAGDCGVCPPAPPACGDETCNGTETCSTCASDCGACPPPPPPPPAPTGLPTSANTGWQHTGVTLKPSGDIVVTQDGTVIDSVDVTGCIYVRANNVTIRRSRVKANCWNGIEIRDWDGVSGLVIEDVEVDGGSDTENCIAFGGYTARRVNLHHCYDGAKIGNDTVIESSYIHDLLNKNECHCDGVQSTGGRNTTLRNNNIDVPGSGAAVMLGDEFGGLENITIEGNRFNGGNFQLYGGYHQSTGYQPVNMSVVNNRFGASFTYGTHVYIAPTTTWSGNVRDASGQALSK